MKAKMSHFQNSVSFENGFGKTGLKAGFSPKSMVAFSKTEVLKKTQIFALLCPILIAACSFDYDTVSQKDDDPNLIMENVEYVRITNGNPEVQVKADELRRYEAKHILELDEFSFEQFNAAPEGQEAIPDVNARGKAAAAHLETDTNNFVIRGGIAIEVVSEDITLETSELSLQNNDRLLNAPGFVHITRSDGTTLKGTGFSADVRKRNWEFESAVEGTVVDDDEKKTDDSAKE